MGGKNRWMDNAFIGRLCKSAKYEDICLKANGWHQNFDRKTPAMVCFSSPRKAIEELTPKAKLI